MITAGWPLRGGRGKKIPKNNKKTNILLGETRAHEVPIHEEKKKFKTRIYIIIPIFPPPIKSD